MEDGLRNGEKVLYITLSESPAELRSVARSHGIQLDGIQFLELEPSEQDLKPEGEYTVFHPAEIELNDRLLTIVNEIAVLSQTGSSSTIVHGVVILEKVHRDYGKTRRRIEVSKLRGCAFREGYHDYIIPTGGLLVFPRLVAAEHLTQSDSNGASGIMEKQASAAGVSALVSKAEGIKSFITKAPHVLDQSAA